MAKWHDLAIPDYEREDVDMALLRSYETPQKMLAECNDYSLLLVIHAHLTEASYHRALLLNLVLDQPLPSGGKLYDLIDKESIVEASINSSVLGERVYLDELAHYCSAKELNHRQNKPLVTANWAVHYALFYGSTARALDYALRTVAYHFDTLPQRETAVAKAVEWRLTEIKRDPAWGGIFTVLSEDRPAWIEKIEGMEACQPAVIEMCKYSSPEAALADCRNIGWLIWMLDEYLSDDEMLQAALQVATQADLGVTESLVSAAKWIETSSNLVMIENWFPDIQKDGAYISALKKFLRDHSRTPYKRFLDLANNLAMIDYEDTLEAIRKLPHWENVLEDLNAI